MRLKKQKVAGGGRRRKKKQDGGGGEDVAENNEQGVDSDDSEDEEALELAAAKNEEAKSSGWDLDQLRHDMFAFIDGDGNVVYEKIEDDDDEDAEDGRGGAKKEEEDEVTSATKQSDLSENTSDAVSDNDTAKEDIAKQESSPDLDTKMTPPQALNNKPISEKFGASSMVKVDSKGLPTAVSRPTPLPRINCATVVRNNTLYIYGGVLEVGDREVTLDDCWSIDLNKRDQWNCIWPGQMHRQVWKGVDSDNDSYISSDQAADDDSDDDDDEMAEFEPIIEGEGDDEESEEARKKAKKAAKKAKEKEKRKGIKHEIADLKEKLGVDNEMRTPRMGESVADFYARTTEYWNVEAANSAEVKIAAERGEFMSSKEMKREGFHLAQARYEELKPVLDRLDELENVQAERSDEKKAKKKKKDEKKPKKDRLR